MPPSYARITAFDSAPGTLEELVAGLNRRIEDLNNVFRQLAVADSEMRGNDGFQPTYNNDLNLARHRVGNVERSREPRDVVTRIELEELGLLTPDGKIAFNRDVVFNSAPVLEGPPGGGNALITEARVLELIAQALEEALAVAVDGDRLSLRTLGINGVDPGNPVMGRDGTGRAEFIQSFDHQLSVHDSHVTTLLTLILEAVRELINVTSNRRDHEESG